MTAGKLKIYKDGSIYSEVQLDTKSEYIIGRGDNVDIYIQGDRGISRRHVKLHFMGRHWYVHNLSKYGELYSKGEKVSEVVLHHGVDFQIPPYQFQFIDNQLIGSVPIENDYEVNSEEEGLLDFSNKTFVGQLSQIVQLKIFNTDSLLLKSFVLEGDQWLGGREITCQFFIDHEQISRQHFHIKKVKEKYWIQDLGSSNGTFVNGKKIDKDWTELHSGDDLQFGLLTAVFEIRDRDYVESNDTEQENLFINEGSEELAKALEYQQKELMLRSTENSTESFRPGNPTVNTYLSQAPFPARQLRKSFSQIDEQKKKKIIWIVSTFLISAMAIYHSLEESSSQKEIKIKQANKILSPFEKLPPGKQELVKDSYRMADIYFKEAKYQLAAQELAKIHQIIPQYEDSKNIAILADNALQAQLEIDRNKLRQKEMKEIEDKIQKGLAECKKLVNSEVQVATIESCLSPYISLNPAHVGFVEIRSQVELIVANRKLKETQRQSYLSQVARINRLYQAAVDLQVKGLTEEAVQTYDQVIASSLPDPQNLKIKAHRQIAAIQNKIQQKQQESEKVAEEALKSGDLRAAYYSLRNAFQLNPDNTALRDKMNSVLVDLRKQMQVFYQEGVLEESVGEIETAKNKWKKILQQSIPEEDYYQKAKIKLKKYGSQ
jgi:pSer/pThr/pTyr-binding forkhead associated (FHA) protein